MAVDSLAPAVPLLKGKIRLDQVDMMMGVGVVAVLLVMIIPLPAFILDILLSLSITCSLVILLTSTYITKPLEFSTFPSMLAGHHPVPALPERGLHPSDPPARQRGRRGRRAGDQDPSASSWWAAISWWASSSSSSWSSSISWSSPRAPAESPKWRHASPWMPCRASRWPSMPT